MKVVEIFPDARILTSWFQGHSITSAAVFLGEPFPCERICNAQSVAAQPHRESDRLQEGSSRWDDGHWSHLRQAHPTGITTTCHAGQPGRLKFANRASNDLVTLAHCRHTAVRPRLAKSNAVDPCYNSVSPPQIACSEPKTWPVGSHPLSSRFVLSSRR